VNFVEWWLTPITSSTCGLEYRYSEPISSGNTSVPVSHRDGKSVEDYEHWQPEEFSKPSNYPKDPQVSENLSDGVSNDTVDEANFKRVTWRKELWAFKKVHVNATGKVGLDCSRIVN
jgi:hypothetical protein